MSYYTENLADFGARERSMLIDLLTAWEQGGLPEGFYGEGVKPAMNSGLGYVFLINEDYQVAMMNNNELEIYHTLPYSGDEGFLCDFEGRARDSFHEDDAEYLEDQGLKFADAKEAA